MEQNTSYYMQMSASNLSATETSIYKTFNELYPVDLWKRYGFYTAQYLHVINVHWLKFEPPAAYSHYILAFIYSLFMMTGLIGNFLVIFLYFRCKRLQTPANALIFNLALSDFLMMAKTPIFIYNSLLLGPALGNIGCQYYGFFGGLTGTVSICTLSAISLDRYYVIKYPLKRSFSYLRIKFYLVMVWLYGILFASVPLLDIGFGTYVPEGYLTSCSFDYLTENQTIREFIWVYFVAAWVVPFLIISYSYLNILFVVISSKKITSKSSVAKESYKHVKEGHKRQQEIKLAITVFLTITLWFFSWTPYAAVAILGITKNAHLITPFRSMVPAVFCKTASCIDPFIYALNHQKFREQFSALYGNKLTHRVHKLFSLKSTEENLSDDVASVSEIIEVEIKNMEAPVKSMNFDEKLEGTSASKPCNIKKMHNIEMTEHPKFNGGKIIPFYAKIFRPSFRNSRSSVRRLAHRLSVKAQQE